MSERKTGTKSQSSDPVVTNPAYSLFASFHPQKIAALPAATDTETDRSASIEPNGQTHLQPDIEASVGAVHPHIALLGSVCLAHFIIDLHVYRIESDVRRNIRRNLRFEQRIPPSGEQGNGHAEKITDRIGIERDTAAYKPMFVERITAYCRQCSPPDRSIRLPHFVNAPASSIKLPPLYGFSGTWRASTTVVNTERQKSRTRPNFPKHTGAFRFIVRFQGFRRRYISVSTYRRAFPGRRRPAPSEREHRGNGPKTQDRQIPTPERKHEHMPRPYGSESSLRKRTARPPLTSSRCGNCPTRNRRSMRRTSPRPTPRLPSSRSMRQRTSRLRNISAVRSPHPSVRRRR